MAKDISILEVVRAAEIVWSDNPIMAKLAAAQAIHESGLQDGKGSALAADYHNLFGIKGSGDAGSVSMSTTEHEGGQDVRKNQNFAAYSSYEESFRAHRQLMENGRYAGVMQAGSIEGAARAVKNAGYATDPNYASKVVATYERYVAPYMGGSDYLARWQQVLKDSPDHLKAELEAMGEEGKKYLADLDASDPQKKEAARQKAIQFVADHADDILRDNQIAVNGRNLTVAQMVGGHMASRLLKPENASRKLSEITEDKQLLASIGKFLGKDGDDLNNISVAQFLEDVDQKQRDDKKTMAEKARASANLSENNSNFLEQMLNGDMSMMEFVFMFAILLMMNSMGIDMPGQQQQQPQQQQQLDHEGRSGELRLPASVDPVTVRAAANASITGGTHVAEIENAPFTPPVDGVQVLRNPAVASAQTTVLS